ncbi:MAG: response regulator [Pseudomonadota bacterium]
MKKILVVDNDRIFVMRMKRLLEKAGHQVEIAGDGLIALDILKTFTPDVLFSDLVMPNIDGRALCRIIRGRAQSKHIPIIIISATFAEELTELFHLDVNACIAKQAFDETAQHVLAVLNQPALASRRCKPGEVIGVKEIYPRGITQELLSVKRHFEAIIDRMSEGIVEINSDGRIVFANSAIREMAGIPEETLLGSRFVDLFSGDERVQMVDILNTKGEKANGIIKDYPSVLNQYHISMDVVSLSEDGLKSLIILRDVTSSKQAENTLKMFNTALENRVRERTAELEAANRFKSEFVANMSHEIRTPMNGVIGACELALREGPERKTREYLEMIHSSAITLMVLVNDILDFSSIESGHIKFEINQFSLRETMEQIYDVFHDRVQEKDLEFAVDIPGDIPDQLLGDPLRLRQIIINLLGNAFKFTDRGEIILRVRIEHHDDRSLLLLFSVTDTGIGIEKDKIPTLFEAFVQVDSSTTRAHSGTGLGLAISKKLAVLMGGDIWAESIPGTGSSFSFTARFDIARIAAEKRNGIGGQRTDLMGIKTLVVDDHPVSREGLGMLVASFGCRVTLAASAHEAVGFCMAAMNEKDMFNLVLLDQKMDEMNGVALAAQISRRYGPADRPVMVMISGYTASIDQAEARKAGIRKILSKPIKRSQLLDELLELFVEDDLPRLAEEINASGAEPDFSGKRVLLVEDNPINQRVAQALLQSANFEVITADDGIAALAVLETETFNAVLMDVQMPRMDGYEATRRIRAQLGLKTLPVIAMTAHAAKEAMEKCLAAGMDDYVSKPIDRARLLNLLKRILDSA